MRTDITQTDTTDLTGGVSDFSVSPQSLDAPTENQENTYDNAEYEEYNGYYFKIPEYHVAVNAYATWVLGKGYTPVDERIKAILENIKGWGEDTFQQILWNLIVMKKVQGDSFAEIIRDPKTGILFNIKPLGTLRIVTNSKGKITRYEQREGKRIIHTFRTQDILHLCNNRYGNQIHGTPTTTSVQWVIDARNEAMADVRRVAHRSTVRVLYIDEDDRSRMTNIKKDYKDAINKGELLILPALEKDAKFQELTIPPMDAYLSWIKYLENFFYQALGVPKVILGGSEEFTESSAKISYLTYEQIYTREVTELEADLWNQLAIKLTFNKPASLQSEMLSGESKNPQEQTGFQPNDTIAGRGE
ncbi:hypothetical protein LCGC14_1745970 [marine sediment metagenome]|uniref:Phage portal protein n=1 Tax=marine sediment metagenome TaxID=412755 RepID=A0A0F9K4Q9_9ZZZZ